MDIVIIGSGNVATVLGRKFIEADHRIIQVVSRNKSAGSNLAKEWKSGYISFSEIINPTADIYLIAVSDDSIKTVVEVLKKTGGVAAHTAGSVSKDILKSVSEHYGVFYPLQSLRKEMIEIPEIPVLYDGNDETAKTKLESLADSISPGYASPASDEIRSKLHLAAVFVNNFTNHLYALAEKFTEDESVNFKKLQPLIEETALKLKEISPKLVQTGPAIRNDEETIRKQLEMLDAYPQLKKIYAYLTESIMSFKRS